MNRCDCELRVDLPDIFDFHGQIRSGLQCDDVFLAAQIDVINHRAERRGFPERSDL